MLQLYAIVPTTDEGTGKSKMQLLKELATELNCLVTPAPLNLLCATNSPIQGFAADMMATYCGPNSLDVGIDVSGLQHSQVTIAGELYDAYTPVALKDVEYAGSKFKVPDWAKFIVADNDGEVHVYTHTPENHDGYWRAVKGKSMFIAILEPTTVGWGEFPCEPVTDGD